ncbi:efflux RND transporter permease subunit [Caballeronia sp. M1242]|uniref:efflux RND transporter permease subunit n=1 Tax=Caballeronia sp. M1242 TaxID=2814653 RepID=UPI0035302A8B
MGIMLASGANALSVAKAVRAQLALLQKRMPGGVQLSVPHDTTPFVFASSPRDGRGRTSLMPAGVS